MPDDAELVKAGVQGMVEGSLSSVNKLILDVFGPAAKVYGLALEERAKDYRERQRRFFEEAKRQYEKSQREYKQVPLTLLLPIIQNGSMEEDDDLQDRWAALLVNLSSQNILIPGAPDILKQLSSFEVLLLQMCFDVVRVVIRPPSLDLDKKPVNEIIGQWYGVLIEKHNFKRSGMAHHHDQAVMMDNLMRLGLLKRGAGGSESIYMTTFGFEFISLCQTHL